ncbi:Uncharacterized protein PBTT_08403 [Plasmodiophora brassicae]
MGPSDAVGGDEKSSMAVVRPSMFEQIAAPKLRTSDRPAIIVFMNQLKTYNSRIQEKIALGENIAPIGVKTMLDEGMLNTICKIELETCPEKVANDAIEQWLNQRRMLVLSDQEPIKLTQLFADLRMVFDTMDTDASVLRLFQDADKIVADNGLSKIVKIGKNLKEVNKIIVSKLSPPVLRESVEDIIRTNEPATWSANVAGS